MATMSAGYGGGISDPLYGPRERAFGRQQESQEAAGVQRERAGYLKMAQEQAANEEARLKRQEELKRQQGEVASEWAIKFLGEWNQNRQQLTGMVNTAFADVDKAWESIQTGKDWLSDLEGHKELVGKEYQSYKEAYAPLEAEARQTQMEALGTQRGLMGRVRELSEADYEGVSGRAKADVASEAERSRKAEERRLQGMGISPESGRSRAAMGRGYADEALSKVLAANRARTLEKQRVGQMATTGLQAIRPEQAGGVSSGIRAQGLDYLREMTRIGETGMAGATGLARAGGELARTRGGIADIYGRQIVQPMGEAGMTFAGTAMAGAPGSMAGQAGIVGGGGGIIPGSGRGGTQIAPAGGAATQRRGPEDLIMTAQGGQTVARVDTGGAPTARAGGIDRMIAGPGAGGTQTARVGAPSGEIAGYGTSGLQTARVGGTDREIAGYGGGGTQVARAGGAGREIAGSGAGGTQIARAGGADREIAGYGGGGTQTARISGADRKIAGYGEGGLQVARV